MRLTLTKKWDYQDDNYYTNTYHHKFECSNCGKVIYINIKKGIKIKGLKVKCQICGCGIK